MKVFIGNPNKDEYYDEDDVESEVYYDDADNFIYLDPNEMGIEIDDDDDDDEDDVDDEIYESLSFGGSEDTSDDEDEYIDDEEEEGEQHESVSDKEGIYVYVCTERILFF